MATNILYQYTMTYPLRACQCGSKMVTHSRTEQAWIFKCSVCKADIARGKIVELEHGCFDRIGSGMGAGRASTSDSVAGGYGNNVPGEPLQIVADGNGERVE